MNKLVICKIKYFHGIYMAGKKQSGSNWVASKGLLDYSPSFDVCLQICDKNVEPGLGATPNVC